MIVERGELDLLYMNRMPSIPIVETGGLKVIPARASFRHARQLAEEAPTTATLVGRFNARSRVRTGQPVEVAVDTRALHFFDPETGLGIYDGTSTKGGGA